MDYGGIAMELSIERVSEIFSRQLMSLPTGAADINVIKKEAKHDKRWNLFKKR